MPRPDYPLGKVQKLKLCLPGRQESNVAATVLENKVEEALGENLYTSAFAWEQLLQEDIRILRVSFVKSR